RGRRGGDAKSRRDVHDRHPRVESHLLHEGEGHRARCAQSGRHAMDWFEPEGLRDSRHRQPAVDRLREIARMHQLRNQDVEPLFAQPPSPYQDVATELAAKIAAALSPAEPSILSFIAVDGADQAASIQAHAEITRALIARGVRVADRGAAATIVRVSCFENL